MSYVDSHVHFWDRSRHTYRWLDSEPRLEDRYTLDHYRLATADDPPAGFVFVQAAAADSDGASEARWVEAMCAGEPGFLGMVVWAPAHTGAAGILAHLDAVGSDRIVGARQLIQWMPDGWLQDPFVEAVAALDQRCLCFDVCILARQMQDAAELVARVPHTRLVIDHLGKPDIAGGELSHWRRHLERLAQVPEVWCKLSGLVTEADHDSWTVEQLRPYVSEALEVFGPGRVLWGSDWPVVTNAASHRRWRDATAELLADLTADELGAVMVRNALECYRVRLPADGDGNP